MLVATHRTVRSSRPMSRTVAAVILLVLSVGSPAAHDPEGRALPWLGDVRGRKARGAQAPFGRA